MNSELELELVGGLLELPGRKLGLLELGYSHPVSDYLKVNRLLFAAVGLTAADVADLATSASLAAAFAAFLSFIWNRVIDRITFCSTAFRGSFSMH